MNFSMPQTGEMDPYQQMEIPIEEQTQRLIQLLHVLNDNEDKKEYSTYKNSIRSIEDMSKQKGFNNYVNFANSLIQLNDDTTRSKATDPYDVMRFRLIKINIYNQDPSFLTHQFLSNLAPDPENRSYQKVDFNKFEQAIDFKVQQCFFLSQHDKNEKLAKCFIEAQKDPQKINKCKINGFKMFENCFEEKGAQKIKKTFTKQNKYELRTKNKYTQMKKEMLEKWHKLIKTYRRKPGFAEYMQFVTRENSVDRLLIDMEIQNVPEIKEFFEYMEHNKDLHPLQKEELSKALQLVMFVSDLQNGRCFTEKLVGNEGNEILQCYLEVGETQRLKGEDIEMPKEGEADSFAKCKQKGLDQYRFCKNTQVIPQMQEFCQEVLRKVKSSIIQQKGIKNSKDGSESQ